MFDTTGTWNEVCDQTYWNKLSLYYRDIESFEGLSESDWSIKWEPIVIDADDAGHNAYNDIKLKIFDEENELRLKMKSKESKKSRVHREITQMTFEQIHHFETTSYPSFENVNIAWYPPWKNV